MWNDWSEGLCSKECGGGIRTNLRTFNQTAAHGGKNCSGPSEIVVNCNIQNCPSKTMWIWVFEIMLCQEGNIGSIYHR